MSHPRKVAIDCKFVTPLAASVNDSIGAQLCTLSYVTVEKVARMLVELGKGEMLAMVDIEATYRLVPVHPEERLLLATRWKGGVYIDMRHPFGLRSEVNIFFL